MGRPRVKIIDDAQEEAPKKASKKKGSEGRLPPNAASSRVDEVDRTRGDEPQGAASEVTPEAGEAGIVIEQEGGAADQSDKKDERATERKAQKPGKAKPRSKKYQELTKDLDRTKTYLLPEAIEMVKKLSYSKFNATLEAHINTAQTGIRGLVSLPFAAGRKLRILAFPSTSLRVNFKGASEQEYEGVVFGDDSTIEEINKGKVNFDLVITTPEWMPKLAKVARILGPRGLMPNPKNGTITDDLKKAVEGFQAGKTEYKTEAKAPVIHLALGKIDQPNEELIANIKTLYQTIGKSRIKKINLSPTMGPSVKVNLTSL